jgi:hypothetical protein
MALANSWSTPTRTEQHAPISRLHNRISQRLLQQLLGVLWLVAGLLQLQPWMWTMNFITGVMQPAVAGQPGPLAAVLQFIVTQTTPYHVAANAMIALVQVALGVCLLRGRWVRPVLLVSVAWSLGVWTVGEGVGMLLTGQAGALNGAPGAVLLYGVLALAAYPTANETGLLTRGQLRLLLAAFWALAGVLQLQPVWWQSGQIAQTITGVESPGTLNGAILGSSLRWLANLTGGVEAPLNIALVILAFGLALGLARRNSKWLCPLLAASIGLSLLLWWATEGFGLLLTGTATDVNSGPLLVVLALACWPPRPVAVQRTLRKQALHVVRMSA